MNNKQKDYAVVTFTNITQEDFTPALGAMYDSVPFLFKAGESMILPYHAAHRMAVNLAKHIINSGAEPRVFGQGNDTQVMTMVKEGQIEAIVDQILSGQTEDEKPANLTEQEKLALKVKELNDRLDNMSGETGKQIGEGYKDKKEVIQALKDKGVAFDPRKTKAELETLLAE